jgi:hypothetical protein
VAAWRIERLAERISCDFFVWLIARCGIFGASSLDEVLCLPFAAAKYEERWFGSGEIGVDPRTELSGVVDVECDMDGISDSSPDEFDDAETG